MGPSSCLCPTPAVLLPCSLQTPILHIPNFSPVPTQLLPSFFPALLHYSQLCSCPAPGPVHPSLAAFIIIISTLRLFSARRQPPFMVFLLIVFRCVESHRFELYCIVLYCISLHHILL